MTEERRSIDPDPLNQYVHHPHYVDAVAVRYYDATLSGTQVRHFYCHDANFNVTSVVNHSGSVQERYAYSPYGEVTFLEPDFDPIAGNASAIGNEMLYTGRTRDPETALYDFRTRFYHAPLGKFTSRDWIEYGGGMNLYAYVGGMPTGYVDPFGLYEIEWEGTWTPAEQQTILQALEAIKKRIEQIQQEMQQKLDGLSPCVRKKVESELGDLLEVFESIIAGIDSSSENLELYQFDLSGVDSLGQGFPAGWHGINGFYSDAQINLNTKPGLNWYTPSRPGEFESTLFHELTHVYGTEDDDSEGPSMNAHSIDNWWSEPVSGAWLHDLIEKAKKECEEEEKRRCRPRYYFPPTIFGPYVERPPFGQETA